ncbi:MAG: 3-hydroxyacyl-ACP dehydratase FabZ family protein [Planctomycetaceae bacterium]
MRFSLVDRIVALAPGESITAVKNVSSAEEYLADHFPGFAVLPGVMMVETLVQAGAWLIRATDDFQHSVVLLKQARAVKFNNFVRPGQALTVRLSIQSRGEGETTLKAQGEVDAQSAVSARLTLGHFNLADKNPALVESDAARVEVLRRQFAEIWPG